MINMRLSIKHTKGFDRVERELPKRVNASLKEAAEALKEDIRTHWSASAPSDYGNPPAIVTGNLDSSISVEKTGRDERGRFSAPKEAEVWFVRIDTSKGDNPMGREGYEQVLENPEQLNRPFVEPAIKRMEGTFPFFFRSIFK